MAALVRAARPVYAELDRDPQTRGRIARIRQLKATLPPAPRIVVPAGCLADRGARSRQARWARRASLNGTYRWLLTAAGARAFGPPADAPGNTYPIVNTIVLRDGSWVTRDDPPNSGTYRIVGDRLVLSWLQAGSDMTFTFSRDARRLAGAAGGTADRRGDRWVWSGAPWRRIGPPTGQIPSGSSAVTLVPLPGGLSTRSLPPSDSTRSRRPRSPLPPAGIGAADAVVGHLDLEPAGARGDAYRCARRGCVLGDVRERLRADEVGRDLELLGQAARAEARARPGPGSARRAMRGLRRGHPRSGRAGGGPRRARAAPQASARAASRPDRSGAPSRSRQRHARSPSRACA